MAKNNSNKTSSPSRIRFVMVEAELGDGDIGQITQAIQNALRGPATAPVRRIASTTISANGTATDAGLELEMEDIDEAEVEDVSEHHAPTKVRSPRKTPPTPDVIEIDMKSDVPLAAFAKGKDSKSQHKKYLIAAAWLKEHRNIDAVTPSHIYTCFRFMEWSTNIPDFGQPLRDLKAKKYFSRNEKNEYLINHLGLDYVARLGGSSEVS